MAKWARKVTLFATQLYTSRHLSNDYLMVVGPMGPKGKKGEKGELGKPGTKGTSGNIGRQGVQGSSLIDLDAIQCK